MPSGSTHDRFEPDPQARFLSAAIDGKRIFTGLLVGIPMAVATYWAAQKVTDYAIEDIKRRLDVQRSTFREEIRASQEQQQREIDQVREDIREIRTTRHQGEPQS